MLTNPSVALGRAAAPTHPPALLVALARASYKPSRTCFQRAAGCDLAGILASGALLSAFLPSPGLPSPGFHPRLCSGSGPRTTTKGTLCRLTLGLAGAYAPRDRAAHLPQRSYGLQPLALLANCCPFPKLLTDSVALRVSNDPGKPPGLPNRGVAPGLIQLRA